MKGTDVEVFNHFPTPADKSEDLDNRSVCDLVIADDSFVVLVFSLCWYIIIIYPKKQQVLGMNSGCRLITGDRIL